jgi:hypothetical protein
MAPGMEYGLKPERAVDPLSRISNSFMGKNSPRQGIDVTGSALLNLFEFPIQDFIIFPSLRHRRK